MMECKVRPDRHAKYRMRTRGISHEELRTCILKGSKESIKTKYNDGYKSQWSRVVAVWKQTPCNYLVCTVYDK